MSPIFAHTSQAQSVPCRRPARLRPRPARNTLSRAWAARRREKGRQETLSHGCGRGRQGLKFLSINPLAGLLAWSFGSRRWFHQYEAFSGNTGIGTEPPCLRLHHGPPAKIPVCPGPWSIYHASWVGEWTTATAGAGGGLGEWIDSADDSGNASGRSRNPTGSRTRNGWPGDYSRSWSGCCWGRPDSPYSSTSRRENSRPRWRKGTPAGSGTRSTSSSACWSSPSRSMRSTTSSGTSSPFAGGAG